MNPPSYTRFRTVQLTHLSPSLTHLEGPSSLVPILSSQVPHAAKSRTQLPLQEQPSSFLSETAFPCYTDQTNGKHSTEEQYKPEIGSNFEKWKQFGLDISKYDSNDCPSRSDRNSRSVLRQGSPAGLFSFGGGAQLSVNVENDDKPVIVYDHSPRQALPRQVDDTDAAQRSEQGHANITQGASLAKGQPSSAACDSSDASPVLYSTLSRNLCELSKQVNSAIEKNRCKPPKKQPSSSFSSGTRWGRKSKGSNANAGDDNTEPPEGAEDQASMVNESHKRERAGANNRGASLPKRSRKSNGTTDPPNLAPEARTTVTKNTTRKERAQVTRKTPFDGPKPKTRAREGGDDAKSRRTLFCLQEPPTSAWAAAGGQEEPGRRGAVSNSSVVFERLCSVNDLFADLKAALNDPDRIQAPPLYVGLLFQGCRGQPQSNLSLSVNSRTKASIMVTAEQLEAMGKQSNISPWRAHELVRDIVLRWKDKAYVMDAASVGIEFILRVLRELIGVELITFNAPALLLPLLSYSQGVLSTKCVSDVRVMAWMISLSDSNNEVSQDGDAITDIRVLAQNCRVPSTASLPCIPGADGDALQRLVNEVFCLAPVYRALYGQLGSRGLLQAFLRQEKRISILIAGMKLNGMRVDMKKVLQFKEMCCADMKKWNQLATDMVRTQMSDFNIQSHDQCRQAIFEVLGLGKYFISPSTTGEVDVLQQQNPSSGLGIPLQPTPANLTITKGGKLSTAEDTLRVLAEHHPFPQYIINYRKSAKILQTYVDGILAYVCPVQRAVDKNVDDDTQISTIEGKEEDIFVDNALVSTASGETTLQNCQGEQDVCGGGGGGLSLKNNKCVVASFGANDKGGEVHDNCLPQEPSTAVTPLEGFHYGVLHPNFIQEGTDTGRVSCVEPNLQNLPRTAHHIDQNEGTPSGGGGGISEVETDLEFRRCFVAPPGCVLLTADYEQIELRVLAHLCGDEVLIDTLTSSTDIHQSIAKVIFNKGVVSAEERNLAKRVVFGMLYGAGPRTLAAQMNVDVERALHVSGLLKTYFPHIHQYQQRIIDQGRADGFVRTISGRIRSLPDLNSSVMGKRAYAERQAFNTVVQGSAADIMKMSMLAVEQEVLHACPNEVHLLSQIHDEMVFSVKRERLREVVPRITQAMTHAMSLLVPICVNVKIGPSLGELKPWSIEHELGIQ